MEQYIPYSLICDLFSRNLETYLHSYIRKVTKCSSLPRSQSSPILPRALWLHGSHLCRTVVLGEDERAVTWLIKLS